MTQAPPPCANGIGRQAAPHGASPPRPIPATRHTPGAILGGMTCGVDGCGRRVIARSMCNMHWKRWRRSISQGAEVRSAVAEVRCSCCGVVFQPDRRTNHCCSRLCLKRFGAVTQLRFTNCKACGVLFTAHGFQWNRTSCSDECLHQLERESARRTWAKNYERAKRSARTHSARRRARLRTSVVEEFTHEEVFERDGWICHLCGEPIDRHLRRPDPGSASLDHIVPLSRGGDHTLANVAASHQWCNQSKHNRPKGEQLRLLG